MAEYISMCDVVSSPDRVTVCNIPKLLELYEEIKDVSIFDPITVLWSERHSKYVILDGVKRFEIAKYLKHTQILAKI